MLPSISTRAAGLEMGAKLWTWLTCLQIASHKTQVCIFELVDYRTAHAVLNLQHVFQICHHFVRLGIFVCQTLDSLDAAECCGNSQFSLKYSI